MSIGLLSVLPSATQNRSKTMSGAILRALREPAPNQGRRPTDCHAGTRVMARVNRLQYPSAHGVHVSSLTAVLVGFADVRPALRSRGICRQFCRQTPSLSSNHLSAIHRWSANPRTLHEPHSPEES